MAQHARPHWYIHNELARPQLRSLVSGLGSLLDSTRPTSHPPEHALAPGVDEPEREHHDEHDHLDEAEPCERVDPHRPREDEYRLDVEHHEQQREHVVADLALRPAFACGIDAALVGDQLLLGGTTGLDEPAQAQNAAHEKAGCAREDDHREVATEETGHVRSP